MDKRRSFLKRFAALGALLGLSASDKIMASTNQKIDKLFLHHVFFWMNDPESPESRKKFEKGLQLLGSIETIKIKQIGVPADTERDVIDNTYHYSFMVGFKNKKDHDIYQKHKTHLEFIDTCSSLWNKVLVYDCVSV